MLRSSIQATPPISASSFNTGLRGFYRSSILIRSGRGPVCGSSILRRPGAGSTEAYRVIDGDKDGKARPAQPRAWFGGFGGLASGGHCK